MAIQPVSHHYELHVDGSPGPKKADGFMGWGLALMAGFTPIYEACGYAKDRGTNHTAELEAITQGLAYLLRLQLPGVVVMWNDNRTAVNTINSLPLLKSRGWCNADGKPLKDLERVRFLYELMYDIGAAEKVVVRWLKGHLNKVTSPQAAGNDIADRLSKLAAYKGEAWYRENHIIIKNEE